MPGTDKVLGEGAMTTEGLLFEDNSPQEASPSNAQFTAEPYGLPAASPSSQAPACPDTDATEPQRRTALW
jgi:hypothetical protein